MNEKAVFAFKKQKAKAAAFSAQAKPLLGLPGLACFLRGTCLELGAWSSSEVERDSIEKASKSCRNQHI